MCFISLCTVFNCEVSVMSNTLSNFSNCSTKCLPTKYFGYCLKKQRIHVRSFSKQFDNLTFLLSRKKNYKNGHLATLSIIVYQLLILKMHQVCSRLSLLLRFVMISYAFESFAQNILRLIFVGSKLYVPLKESKFSKQLGFFAPKLFQRGKLYERLGFFIFSQIVEYFLRIF